MSFLSPSLSLLSPNHCPWQKIITKETKGTVQPPPILDFQRKINPQSPDQVTVWTESLKLYENRVRSDSNCMPAPGGLMEKWVTVRTNVQTGDPDAILLRSILGLFKDPQKLWYWQCPQNLFDRSPLILRSLICFNRLLRCDSYHICNVWLEVIRK